MFYTPFAISNFRTGFDQAVEPWLLPRDGFQVMKNSHLYRGVVESISGYETFARMSNRRQIAMNGDIDGVNDTFSVNLPSAPVTDNFYIQATTNLGATITEVFRDDGDGNLSGSNGGTGTVDYNAPYLVEVVFGGNVPVMLPNAGPNVYNTVLLAYDEASTSGTAIMGIKPYYGSNSNQDILVFDQKRMGVVVSLEGLMSALQGLNYGISEAPHEVQQNNIDPGFDGVSSGPFTGTLANVPLTPGQVSIQLMAGTSPTSASLGTIVDNGAGRLEGTLLNPALDNYINYTTGEYVLNFLVAPSLGASLRFSYTVYGNIFSGDISAFFSVTNYQGYAFFSNNLDPIMYYDGSSIKLLNTNLTEKPNTIAPYDVSRCLHVQVHRERLLLLAPIAEGNDFLNGIVWSRAGQPLDFTNDERLGAPTSEYIITYSIINYDMVVRFSASEYVFRYTSDANSPFRWDRTNSLWRCDAPYSAINYDSYFTSVGLPAIVASNGVNVTRIDELIPDFTSPQRIADQMPAISIDSSSIGQCYGERFDIFKEGWLCYRGSISEDTDAVQESNAVLAFNYQDTTYSVYTFPFSCLGFGRSTKQLTWGTNYDYWGEAEETWGSYTQDNNALINLAGGFSGEVYEIGKTGTMGDPNFEVLNPVKFEAITKNFNPFIEEGQLVRLGYVDFLVSSDVETQFRVQFYIDDLMTPEFNTYTVEQVLDCAGPDKSKVWKRAYFGGVGKSVTLRIYQADEDFTPESITQSLRIHCMTLWMKSAGRIYG